MGRGWGYRGVYRRFFSHSPGGCGLLNLECLPFFAETHGPENDNLSSVVVWGLRGCDVLRDCAGLRGARTGKDDATQGGADAMGASRARPGDAGGDSRGSADPGRLRAGYG